MTIALQRRRTAQEEARSGQLQVRVASSLRSITVRADRARKVGGVDIRAFESRPSEIGICKVRISEICIAQIRSAQIRPAEIGYEEACMSQIRDFEIRAGEICAVEMGAEE